MDLWGYVPAEWHGGLSPVRSEIESIGHKLAELESTGHRILPSPGNIFRALQTDPRDVQVIIVGQDPYPNPLHACGLSFSVQAGTHPLPGSLRNLLAEVVSDVGSTQIVDGDLQPWAYQGVMLLNRTLTVSAGETNSHAALGWQVVTDRIVEVVMDANPLVIGVLWGKQAQSMANKFTADNVVEGVHPSPLSAHRGFFGSKPFSAVNAKLISRQQSPILW